MRYVKLASNFRKLRKAMYQLAKVNYQLKENYSVSPKKCRLVEKQP